MAGYLVTTQARNRKRVFVVGMCSDLGGAEAVAEFIYSLYESPKYRPTVRVVDDAGNEYRKWE